MAGFIYCNFSKCEYHLSDTRVKTLPVPSHIMAVREDEGDLLPSQNEQLGLLSTMQALKITFVINVHGDFFPTSRLDICKKIGSLFHTKFPL